MIVYVHKNPKTEKVFYVGIGVNKERAYKFKGKQRNQYWHNHVKKYGNPIVEIIAELGTREDAVKLEMALIAKYGRLCNKSGCLVNITLGGDGGALGVKQTEVQKEKRAAKLRGFTHTEESKANMKAAQNRPEVRAKHEAYKKDPKWIDIQRNAKIGKKLTEDHKAKIALGNKGKVNSQETNKKISIANKGKTRTLEQKLKVSKAKMGVKLTESHKINSANGHKKVILNTSNGIYYNGVYDAASSIGMKESTLRCKMTGHSKNNTSFVYA